MTEDTETTQSRELLHKVAWRLGVLELDPKFRDLKRLNLQQLEFVCHPLTTACHLAACPGSGKTEVVGIKAAYEFASWTDEFSGIAILTFTRSAASEIQDRVFKYGGISATQHPHFIGTFDSWLHAYLFQPFAHSLVGFAGHDGDKKMGIIDNESHADFLNAFQTLPLGGGMPVKANAYSYKPDGSLETSDESIARVVNNPQYCSALKQCKDRFWRAGFATYEDAEYLSFKLLQTKPGITKLLACRFPVIIIDECQDLSPAELALLEQLCESGAKIHFVGDLNQAIYEFRHVEPALIESFSKAHGFIEKRLTHNYRSNQQIVECCQKLMRSNVQIKGMEEPCFSPSCILVEYESAKINELPDAFRKLIDRLQLKPNRCAILARGKSTIAKMNPQGDKARSVTELFASALSCFYNPGHKTENLTAALDQVGRCICNLAYKGKGNHTRQYCPEDQDSIRWRLFLWEFLKTAEGLFPFAQNGNALTWSKWAALLKSFLEAHWSMIPPPVDGWDSVKNRIKAPKKKATAAVGDAINPVKQVAKVRTATIHSTKGETLEAVMLVSSPDKKSKGGHFEHWLDPGAGNEEHKRFAYVAGSRPKYLLIIAAKTLSQADREKLQSIGLVPVSDMEADVHPIQKEAKPRVSARAAMTAETKFAAAGH